MCRNANRLLYECYLCIWVPLPTTAKPTLSCLPLRFGMQKRHISFNFNAMAAKQDRCSLCLLWARPQAERITREYVCLRSEILDSRRVNFGQHTYFAFVNGVYHYVPTVCSSKFYPSMTKTHRHHWAQSVVNRPYYSGIVRRTIRQNVCREW